MFEDIVFKVQIFILKTTTVKGKLSKQRESWSFHLWQTNLLNCVCVNVSERHEGRTEPVAGGGVENRSCWKPILPHTKKKLKKMCFCKS